MNILCSARTFFGLMKICKKCAQQFITAMICKATNIKINPCDLRKSGILVALKFCRHILYRHYLSFPHQSPRIDIEYGINYIFCVPSSLMLHSFDVIKMLTILQVLHASIFSPHFHSFNFIIIFYNSTP